jgi:hypothetical protein
MGLLKDAKRNSCKVARGRKVNRKQWAKASSEGRSEMLKKHRKANKPMVKWLRRKTRIRL